MADDDVDPELVALLRATLLGPAKQAPLKPDSGVLKDAEYIYDHALDVAIDYLATKEAAVTIWRAMKEQDYSYKSWSNHTLHPQLKNADTVAFIFTMNLLNFSFWPDEGQSEPFTVDYRGQRWTGYWTLVAALQRALEEGIPITDPHFWVDENEFNAETLQHVFRSCTSTDMPLLMNRLQCLRSAGQVLYQKYDCSFLKCIAACSNSGVDLVCRLVEDFEVFRDESVFEGKPVRFYKRAQILVADLWACFGGIDYGRFDDIDDITMFADYRVPQMLHQLGCLQYSPPLISHILSKRILEPGHPWEVQLRGCSIWCVELIRRQILKHDAEASVNAVLIDFFLYDTVKKLSEGDKQMAPHHRTRCIWY